MYQNTETGKGFDIDATAAIAQLRKETDRRFTIGSEICKWFECISIMDNYREHQPLHLKDWGFVPRSCIFTRALFAFGSIALTLLVGKLFIEGKGESFLADTVTNIFISFLILTFLLMNNAIVSIFALSSDKLVNIMRFRNIISNEHYMSSDYWATIIIGIVTPAINTGIIMVMTHIHPLLIIATYIVAIPFYRKELIEMRRSVNTFFPSEVIKENHPHN